MSTPDTSTLQDSALGYHEPDPHRWQALALVCVAFFMTVLDGTIVTVALPSIRNSLHVSDTKLQWVLIAYTITYGGLLLLGGRTADLLGRRRLFMIGVAIFSAASLVCGLANTIGVLIAARAAQGVGAAIVSPATLSIITTTFQEGAERNKELGIWGAIGGSGAAAGVLLGGRPHEVRGMGVDLLRQRPGGRARAGAEATDRPREPDPGAARLRRGRRGHDHVKSLAARLRDLESA